MSQIEAFLSSCFPLTDHHLKLGVVIFILIGGYPPFQNADQKKHFENIKNGRYEFNDQHWGTITDEAKNLIRCLLCDDPKQRISATDALDHPWMQIHPRQLRRSSLNPSIIHLREFNYTRKFKSAVNSVSSSPTPRPDLCQNATLMHRFTDCVCAQTQVIFLNKLSLNSSKDIVSDGEESSTGVFSMRQKENSIY